MEKLKSDYPTEEQMKETWDAVESGDHKSLVEILRKRRQEREDAEGAEDSPAGKCATALTFGFSRASCPG